MFQGGSSQISLSGTKSNLVVREITCASVLHRLGFPYFSEYTANFYKGCIHGCDYCYAPSLIHEERIWGTFVDAKVNAPQVLRRELKFAKTDVVFISSATDPYQPIEAKYKITRKCLELLLANNFPVLILTRSPLVLRDIDILKKFHWVRVGFSISTLSDKFHEPRVVPLEKRLEALHKLKNSGIKTWVSLAPIIPGLSMINLESLFRKFDEVGVSCVSAGLLRFNGYAESKKMFESKAKITSLEASEGGPEVMQRINALMKCYGLDRSDDIMSWRNPSAEIVLDSFTTRS